MVPVNVDICRLPVALRMLEGQASVGQRRSSVEMDLFRVGRWGQVHAVAGCIESAKRFRLCGSASRASLYSMCNGQVGRRWRLGVLRLVLILPNNFFEDQQALEKRWMAPTDTRETHRWQ